jgi:ABC-type iron transport system FetAB ATPase subunit
MSDLFSSVNINSSFQRSARIDNKISSEFLDHFVFHDTSKKVLNQISSSLLNSNQSGFTLTGPYGTGKSSLALFLKALISKESAIKKQAESIAKFNNKHLFSRVFLNKKSWFTLNVIGSKDDPIDSIAEQIDQTVNENWISKTIPPILKTKTKKTVAGVIKSLNNLVLELNKKNHGLILIVDEMGKFLDYASSVGSDLNLFQEIAENFSNNRLNKEGEPVFIGILHQPFEEYASSLGRTVQEDWQKIQGRFEDIPFSINSEETAHLIAKAIKQKKTGSEFVKLANSIIKTISGKPNKSYADVLSKCNPIHPLVTLLLNPYFKTTVWTKRKKYF